MEFPIDFDEKSLLFGISILPNSQNSIVLFLYTVTTAIFVYFLMRMYDEWGSVILPSREDSAEISELVAIVKEVSTGLRDPSISPPDVDLISKTLFEFQASLEVSDEDQKKANVYIESLIHSVENVIRAEFSSVAQLSPIESSLSSVKNHAKWSVAFKENGLKAVENAQRRLEEADLQFQNYIEYVKKNHLIIEKMSASFSKINLFGKVRNIRVFSDFWMGSAIYFLMSGYAIYWFFLK